MGGVPLLLVAVAMGITYGWQPDGNGGVDYTIQIPPEQVDQLRQGGTISSAIDPQVCGHISRVIVKVGKAPLPRITPSGLVEHRSSPVIVAAHSSAADRAHVPVPEINSSDGRSPHSILLKPDANDPGRGPGMALPPSLAGAADTAAQASNGLRDAMSGLTADLATRTRNEINQAAAQAQAAGSRERALPCARRWPLKTPIETRDLTWRQGPATLSPVRSMNWPITRILASRTPPVGTATSKFLRLPARAMTMLPAFAPAARRRRQPILATRNGMK